jgi:hypothetical protein
MANHTHTPEQALNLYSNAVNHLEVMRQKMARSLKYIDENPGTTVNISFDSASLEWLYQRVDEILDGRECRGGKESIMEHTLKFFAQAMDREMAEDKLKKQ